MPRLYQDYPSSQGLLRRGAIHPDRVRDPCPTLSKPPRLVSPPVGGTRLNKKDPYLAAMLLVLLSPDTFKSQDWGLGCHDPALLLLSTHSKRLAKFHIRTSDNVSSVRITDRITVYTP